MKKQKMFVIALMLNLCLALGGCASQGGGSAGTGNGNVQGKAGTGNSVQESNTQKEENMTEEITMEKGEKQADKAESSDKADRLTTTTYEIEGVKFKMILVEAGTFTMGSDNSNVAFSESPAHKVTISHDYLIGESEVTESLWNAVMGKGGGSDSMPKTSVTWEQAHDFVDRLNEEAHKQGIIPDGQNFKLPTEAEWEFAAKGGNQSRGYKYSGSDNIDDVAQTLENTGSGSPVKVMQKKPNELGIYDMSGNAYEWVDDYAGDYSAADQTDPQNTTPSGSYVKRGGSNYHGFEDEPYLFTTTGRYFYGSTDWTIGFRIALQ